MNFYNTYRSWLYIYNKTIDVKNFLDELQLEDVLNRDEVYRIRRERDISTRNSVDTDYIIY